MKVALSLLLSSAMTCSSVLASSNTTTINSALPTDIQVGFNALPAKKTYTGALFRNDWKTCVWDGTRGRACIESDYQDLKSKLLRIKYPAHQFGPVNNGGQALVRLKAGQEYYLSYRVRFQKGFDFRKGGKLPGLASGDGKYSNGKKPIHGDGWTARLMWLEDGKLVPYIYSVGMPKTDTWGEYWDISTQLKTDVWYTIKQHIRLNQNGQRNGLYRVWVNNRLVTQRSDMLWRYADKGLIDSFIFSTFHGGNTPDWAPRWDCFADFDDFHISNHPI